MAQAPPFPAEASFNLLNKSKDVFVIADTSGTLRFASPSAANLFGFKNGASAAASACERCEHLRAHSRRAQLARWAS
jgi:hypothetical protein